MSLTQVLPFNTTAIMIVFSVSVLNRFVQRRSPAFLFWGIGLAMFGAASLAEAYLAVAWSPLMVFVWYFFGAVLTAAWIGQGTVYLLFRRRWVPIPAGPLGLGGPAALGLFLRGGPG